MFQAHILKNIWQLLMVLFQFIPKSGIFDGFQLLGIVRKYKHISKCIKVHHFNFFSLNK